MKSIKTILTTEAMFSDDGKKRYLLKKVWKEKEPSLTIVMLAPSEAGGIVLDTTTQLVLNNAENLGFGSVMVVNLSPTINDFHLKAADDVENQKIMAKAFKEAATIIYAAGVGKVKNKTFQRLQEKVAELLRPHEAKLKCLCDAKGNSRLQHPLSPAVRTWYLSPLAVEELLPEKPVEAVSIPLKSTKTTTEKKGH